MNGQETQHLTRIVERVKAINAEMQALKWEAKELAESAWDKAGVRPKVVKQLAKESAWDEVQREAQRQHEEALDQCRAALGLLADLPLGQAAQGSVTNPTLKADGSGRDPVKRSRGRPPGARNKPKLATSGGTGVPDTPPPAISELSAA